MPKTKKAGDSMENREERRRGKKYDPFEPEELNCLEALTYQPFQPVDSGLLAPIFSLKPFIILQVNNQIKRLVVSKLT